MSNDVENWLRNQLSAFSEKHSDDIHVEAFAVVMKDKLAKSRLKGRGGWETCAPDVLSNMMWEHMDKGDPIDVANFAMMLFMLGAPIGRNPAESLDLETLLAKMHEEIWHAAEDTAEDEQPRLAYDEAGNKWAKDVIKLHKAVVANLKASLVQLNKLVPWKEAVIDALVANHSLTIWHEDQPVKAVADLIAIECKMALDPAISEQAAALKGEFPKSHGTHIIQWADELFIWYDESGLMGGCEYSLAQAEKSLSAYSDQLEGSPPSLPIIGWQPIDQLEDKYVHALFLYDPALEDPDFNPDGVVEGYWQDGEGDEGSWIGAVWCGQHDEWHAKKIKPTHFMLKSKPQKDS